MYDNDKKIGKKGYTLTYLLNGKMKYKEIETNDFYTANERALNILKNEKALENKFTKNMNIKLRSNNNPQLIYKLKWNKHPHLSGAGGYFSTFEFVPREKSEKVKPNTTFGSTYGLPLAVFGVGALIYFVTLVTKYEFLEAKFIWLLCTLMYSALLPLVRSNFNEKIKNKWGILWYNLVLDSPLWLGALMSLNTFFRGDIVHYKPGAIVSVFFFFVLKLFVNYHHEKEKFYNNKLLKTK